MPILANVGLPMIFIQWPLMLCALVPVIVVEGLLIRRWVPLSYRDAFLGIGKANLFSTLVGVPLAWLVMFALEFAVMLPLGLAAEKWKWEVHGAVWQVLGFLISAAWLGPAQGQLHWMVPAAVALSLVPCFYLSVVLERRSCTRTWAAADPSRVRRGVFAVNLASYALLFILACGWMTFELVTKGPRVERARAEQVAPPNGGPAPPLGSAGVMDGPPSVSFALVVT
jgi:hypothetical protein